MIMDQANKLRELAQQIRREKRGNGSGKKKKGSFGPTFPSSSLTRIIAVTSGKGGVGKSSLTVNLAICLSQMGKRVLILDADLGLANIDVMVGITPREKTLQNVVTGRKRIKDIILEGPEGIHVIANGSGIQELANLSDVERENIIKEVGSLEGLYDYLLIDTGAGISKNVMSFILATEEIVIVTTPEPTAVMDAYGIIKVVSQQNSHIKVKLLVNMVKNKNEAEAVITKLVAVSQRFLGISVERFGYIYSDTQVSLAIRHKTPLVIYQPQSVAARCIRSLAERLTDHDVHMPSLGMKDVFQRMAEVFR